MILRKRQHGQVELLQQPDIHGITWYNDKFTPDYVDVNNFSVYISKTHESEPNLRLKIHYTADDWLFIESYTIKSDKNVMYITEDKYGEIKSDNGGGDIWKWLDRRVSDIEYEIIKAVAYGKDGTVFKVRMV